MSTLPMSANEAAEESIIKIEKIEQLPEKICVHTTEGVVEEKSEKCLEKIETNKHSEKVADETPGDQNRNQADTNDTHSIEEKASEIEKSNINLADERVKNSSDSVPCCPNPGEKVIRNQSDIFSLKDISTTLQTSIFSVNGSPSRRVFRKQQPAGHVFQKNEIPPSEKSSPPEQARGSRITKENYNDEKRPSSSYRNPLTGTGLTSSDEYKSKGNKRKDGNPLLGLGYDNVAAESSQ